MIRGITHAGDAGHDDLGSGQDASPKERLRRGARLSEALLGRSGVGAQQQAPWT